MLDHALELPLAPDGVDPERIPYRTLPTGARMPAIGLGTFGSDHYDADTIAQGVLTAAEVGYRHFDCAAVYGNESHIGASLEAIQRAGVARDEMFITSKLWNDSHGEEEVLPACRRSLDDLRLDALDMYLVHWPFRTTIPRGAMWTRATPARGPTSMPSTCALGGRWSASSRWGWSATSAPPT